jgi:lipoyl(octanoyl) transferase
MTIDWKITKDLVQYSKALEIMEERVAQIIKDQAHEMAWLLEHPSLYTAGTSATKEDLLQDNILPVFQTGRGGKYTYHGPKQRIMYLMLDLKRRAQPAHPDLKKYVYNLEQLIIDTLKNFDIEGERKQNRIGIWVTDKNGIEAKIAAIGIRIKKWVTYHGIAINVDPALEHFNGIVPCGIKEYGITSMYKLNKKIKMNELDQALKKNFNKIFT